MSNLAVHLGRNIHGSNESISIDVERMEAPFWLFIGKSGAGKSHTIRNVINQLNATRPTFHILGYHPDFYYQQFLDSGATSNIRETDINVIDFTYETGNGFIDIVTPLPSSDGSGEYSAMEELVSYFKVANPSMGNVQVSYLRDIITEVYRKGRENGAETSLKSIAAEIDMVRSSLISKMSLQMLKAIGKARRKMQKLKDKGQGDEPPAPSPEENINDPMDGEDDGHDDGLDDYEKARAAIIDGVTTLIDIDDSWNDSREYYAGWNVSTLDSLSTMVSEMIRPGFFTRSHGASPKKGRINFYNISECSPAHQSLLTHIMLTRFYNRQVLMCGNNLNPPIPDTYIVADEARYLKAPGSDITSPINVISGGARKFGMGMLVGGQGAEQLSMDMSQAFAVKIVMASNEISYPKAKQLFGLNPQQMNAIEPRKSAWLVHQGSRKLVHLFQ